MVSSQGGRRRRYRGCIGGGGQRRERAALASRSRAEFVSALLYAATGRDGLPGGRAAAANPRQPSSSTPSARWRRRRRSAAAARGSQPQREADHHGAGEYDAPARRPAGWPRTSGVAHATRRPRRTVRPWRTAPRAARLVVARPPDGREDDHRDDVRDDRECGYPAARHAGSVCQPRAPRKGSATDTAGPDVPPSTISTANARSPR